MYLYIIKSKEFFKVGITSNLKTRIKTYMCHNPEVEMIKSFKFENHTICSVKTIEKYILEILKNHYQYINDWIKTSEKNINVIIKYILYLKHKQKINFRFYLMIEEETKNLSLFPFIENN